MNLYKINFTKDIIDSLIKLKRVNKTLYEGAAIGSFNKKQIYGGTLVGHAISASYNEVSEGFYLHNINSHYIKKGIMLEPLRYNIINVVRTKSFNRIMITCTQNDNNIAFFTLSFKTLEPSDTFVFDPPYKSTIEFDSSHSVSKILSLIKNPNDIQVSSLKSLEDWLADVPFELRFPDISLFTGNQIEEPFISFWFQLKNKIDDVNDMVSMKHGLVGFMSDFGVLFPIIGKYNRSPAGYITSLNHTIWFHDNNFDINEPFYIHSRCLRAGGCLSLNLASIRTKNKVHIATIVQEGIVREQVPGKKISSPFQ